jgi:propanol-preferring alcohol dehydrogenase
MKAMVLEAVTQLLENKQVLKLVELPIPIPSDDEVLIKISVCGVCHTEIDEIEGRTSPTRFPIILGHQVIGRVADCGKRAKRFEEGDRVGVAWIHSACGTCYHCVEETENLCSHFKATGRDNNGGYAEYMIVGEYFAYRIPEVFTDAQAAPLLCAGAIGYRSLRLSGMHNGKALGLTGFGASAHLVLKLSKFLYPESFICVFARSETERKFALELGADWSGNTEDKPPELLDCIIDTTPVWNPIVKALEVLKSGGRLVINAIRKEDTDKAILQNVQYEKQIWMEKEIKSVANVTRKDVVEFLEIGGRIPLIPEVQEYKLEDANTALWELKRRKIRGAKVLLINN